jgi:hypothetical protein
LESQVPPDFPLQRQTILRALAGQQVKRPGKVRLGKRYTIYGPKDGQTAWHGRQDGKGIGFGPLEVL